jgi:hypothetical protein
MGNGVNEIRRKISGLRAEMLDIESSISGPDRSRPRLHERIAPVDGAAQGNGSTAAEDCGG